MSEEEQARLQQEADDHGARLVWLAGEIASLEFLLDKPTTNEETKQQHRASIEKMKKEQKERNTKFYEANYKRAFLKYR